MTPFRNARRPSAERTPIRAEAPVVKSEGTVATLRLFDAIDSWGDIWGVSAKEFAQALDELPEGTTEIRLLINSPGGEVMEGIAIMNALRSHPARIVAVVEGLAASSASFIAAAADELVMMQNSQLYIHNAWGMVIGDAADLRAVADQLENHFDRNIASIYAAKSGDSVEHWLAEMEGDRFLTAEQAVAEKLADRIEGVADPEAVKARFDLTAFARADGRRAAALPDAPKPPSSTEPGDTNQKETVVSNDALKAGIRERLGITDAAADDETIFASLDAIVDAATAPQKPAAADAKLPDGAIVVDKAAHEQLQADAAAGRKAMDMIDSARRDGIIVAALQSGRIAAASKDSWRAQLDKDEDGIASILDALPENTSVPVAELGHSDTLGSADDALYASAGWGTSTEKKEA